MKRRITAWLSWLIASSLYGVRVEAVVPGDVVVADASRELVAIARDTGSQSLLPLPPIGTGEQSSSVGFLRRGALITVGVAPIPGIPVSEIHLGTSDTLDEPRLVWTVPDVISDVDGSSSPDAWYAVGDHLWQLIVLRTPTGSIGVARLLADVAGPFQRGRSLRVHETDDGGGGQTPVRILIAAGGDGVLSWDAETGVLSPFGGSPPSPTPPNDIVWGVDDADDSPLAFGTTQFDIAGAGCGPASGFLAFALLGFGPAATGGLLQCALGLAFADADTAYVTAVDDLFVGGNPRVVRLESDAGVWSAAVLASGAPLSAPFDLEVVPEPLPTLMPSACDRLLAVTDTTDVGDANPGNGICATAFNACTLRAAVMEANAVISRDCITLPAGTFPFTLSGEEDDAEAGDLDLLDDVVISGAGADATIIDAAGLDRVFEVHENGAFGVVLQGLTLRNGINVYGGAIDFRGGALALDDVTLRDNIADYGEGGAIYLPSASAATIRRSRLTGGQAFNASAIYAGGPIVIEDSTVYGNALDGPGASVIQTFSPSAFVRSTLHDNKASSLACVVEAHGGAAFRNVTFSGNRDGPAICVQFAESHAALWNVTIAAHRNETIFDWHDPDSIALLQTVVGAPSGGGVACTGPVHSLGANVDPDGTCIGDGPGDLPSRGARLGPLADNGGATLTHAPRAGSPLLDAGRDTACSAHDQRGSPRPGDGDGDGEPRCDIGAVELVPEPAGRAAPALEMLVLLALCARRRRALAAPSD